MPPLSAKTPFPAAYTPVARTRIAPGAPDLTAHSELVELALLLLKLPSLASIPLIHRPSLKRIAMALEFKAV